jgi:hypothetical protein
MALLIWAAARRGQRWAAWVYFAVMAVALVPHFGKSPWPLLTIVAFYFFLFPPSALPTATNK